MQMNNIRVYDPEVKPFGNVQYFCDDKGRDWYENNTSFRKKYVVQYNSHGVVKALVPTEMADRLHPGGTSIAEINTIPKDFSLSQAIWLFDGKKLTSTDFDPSIPTSYRKSQFAKAISAKITPLQDAVDLEIATEEEKKEFAALRKLRVELMRISDDTPVSEVDWKPFIAA